MDGAALRLLLSPEFWRMAVLWTLSLVYSYFCIRFFPSRSPSFPRRSSASPGICVVTGATSGLGKAAAAALAGEGYRVVLVGRSAHMLSKTIEDIRKQQVDALLHAFEVDLSSYSSILKFESSLRQWMSDLNLHHSIQLLINNAGILATSYRPSPDGFNLVMATNYIAPFILTSALLPLLKSSPVPSRIVNVTSFTHRSVAPGVDVSEEALRCAKFHQFKGNYYPFASTYEYSKFCLLLFTYELHRRLQMDLSPNVSVIAADPGTVETNIMREFPSSISTFAIHAVRLLNLSQLPNEGVNSIVDAALASPDASGKYFFGGKGRTINSSPCSYDTKLAQRLWSASSALQQELERGAQRNQE